MPTRYATLNLTEGDFGADGGNEADRDLLFAYLGFASRRVEEYCRRRFDMRIETRRYDAVGLHLLTPSTLDLDGAPSDGAPGEAGDLLALTALVNGDGVSVALENTMLWPYNAYPKTRIMLPPGARWTWTTTPAAAIQVTGTWGFHREPVRAWRSAGVAVPAGGLAADATTLALSDVGAIRRGHTLQIDDEQLSVEGIAGEAPTYTLILDRALNGTAAAAHVAGAPIRFYVPEDTIQRATARVAVWMYRQRDAPFDKVVTPLGEVVVPAGLPTDVRYMLSEGRFVRRRAGGVYAV